MTEAGGSQVGTPAPASADPLPAAARRAGGPRSRIGGWLLAGACFVLVLVAHRSVPFVSLPSVWGPIGWMGFAEDVASADLLSPYFSHVGYPSRIPLAFGLTGVWPMALLIRAGVPAVEAYVLVEAAFLLVAFAGAVAFGRAVGVGRGLAVGMATVWLTLPIVWATTTSYLMTGWGFALLPAGVWVVLVVVRDRSSARGALARGLALVAVLVLGAFLDGYSFVMLVVAGGLLLVVALVVQRGARAALLVRAVLPFALGAALGYGVYGAYVAGLPAVVSSSVEYFRAFGADLLFLVTPARGATWLWDVLGASQPRDVAHYWGDPSVWMSTFSIALLALGAAAGVALLARARGSRRMLAAWLACVAVLGLYLALGPSVKVGATIPGGTGPSTFLPAELAGPATGSAWVFETLPGVTSMRATYRWLALAALGSWGLVLLVLPALARRGRALAVAVVVGLLVVHLPSVPAALAEGRQARATAAQLDGALVEPLREVLVPGERVILAPAGNDFVANHLAARLGVRAYNVGGDRHNVAARAAWPPEVARVSAVARPGVPGQARDDAAAIVAALRSGHLDAVVLPYADLFFYEPCDDPAAADASCHASYEAVAAVLDALESDPATAASVRIERLGQAAVVRLAAEGDPADR